MKKIEAIKTLCDSFDRDFDDGLEFLAKIAKIVESKNRILEDEEDEQ